MPQLIDRHNMLANVPVRVCYPNYLNGNKSLFYLLLLFRSGNLSDLARAGSLHEYLVELHENYGKIVGFWWGKDYVVSLSSTEYWKEIQPLFDRPCKTDRSPIVILCIY